jgi:hypothetical protein
MLAVLRLGTRLVALTSALRSNVLAVLIVDF